MKTELYLSIVCRCPDTISLYETMDTFNDLVRDFQPDFLHDAFCHMVRMEDDSSDC